jgi:ABC-type branched-subunit amino acid transport system ATPase component
MTAGAPLLDVPAGECVCLLGRNGVGKSTTMRSIIDLTPPQAERVAWKGTDITGWAPYRVVRAGIGFVPEDRRILGDLTVWETSTSPGNGAPGPSNECSICSRSSEIYLPVRADIFLAANSRC